MSEFCCSLQNKAVLCVSAKSGLAQLAAIFVAAQGARLTILGPAADQHTVTDLTHLTGNKNIFFIECDLESAPEITRAASLFSQSNDRLDILINLWVGGGSAIRASSAVRASVCVPYLLNHALTGGLWQLIRYTPCVQVILIGGRCPFGYFFQAKDLERKGIAKDLENYLKAMQQNSFFTASLQRRLGPLFKVNCFDPGIHGICDSIRGIPRFAKIAEWACGVRELQCLKTLAWLMTSYEALHLHGNIITSRGKFRSLLTSTHTAMEESLWTAADALCKASRADYSVDALQRTSRH